MKMPAFSLRMYLFVVCALSWPFQIAYGVLGEPYRPILLVSMIMAGVASYICGKYIFKDGFREAGWSWGKPILYLFAFALPLFLWAVPMGIERVLGLSGGAPGSPLTVMLTFLTSFLVTLIPAFGEEFSWRGYLLPRLMYRYPERKALFIHGLITWFWHLPVIVVMGMNAPGNMLVTIPALALISLIPTTMHAVVFAYFWSVSRSVVVSTVYHTAFDETRDMLQGSIGFGPLVEVWQMVFLTVLGLLLLWKGKFNLFKAKL